MDKETIIYNLKRLVYCILNEIVANKIADLVEIVNTIFNKYFIGKILDSIFFYSIAFV